MKKNLFEKLKEWRDKTARRKGVEFYRVLNNQALQEIAEKLPQSKGELLEIKGIKEKKYAQYGQDILSIVQGEGEEFIESFEQEEKIYNVGEYLDHLNAKFLEYEARVKGEVSSVDIRGSYIFFGIRDKNGEALINCFMWARDYAVSGIELEEGMEVVIWGYPNVFKPSGRLSFQTKLIELVGEGLLKKAYDELKRKLEAEGVFSPERKKFLPQFPQRIGLITSHQGAAIGDFISNIGSYGFNIKFYDSRVEGKQAVFDLIKGIKWFNMNAGGFDVLVLVRGGGSLESLQAFNSETLVREIAASKVPILAGVGHEKDVSLAALAADKMVSTPTAAALLLRQPWDEAIHKLERNEKLILSLFDQMLAGSKSAIRDSEHILSKKFENIFTRFRQTKENLGKCLMKTKMIIELKKNILESLAKDLLLNYSHNLRYARERTKLLDEKIKQHNPERQLRLGYSLVSLRGKIVRSIREIKIGNEISTKMSDGIIKSKVSEIN